MMAILGMKRSPWNPYPANKPTIKSISNCFNSCPEDRVICVPFAVMACPIMDDGGKLQGVIQLRNKLDEAPETIKTGQRNDLRSTKSADARRTLGNQDTNGRPTEPAPSTRAIKLQIYSFILHVCLVPQTISGSLIVLMTR